MAVRATIGSTPSLLSSSQGMLAVRSSTSSASLSVWRAASLKSSGTISWNRVRDRSAVRPGWWMDICTSFSISPGWRCSTSVSARARWAR